MDASQILLPLHLLTLTFVIFTVVQADHMGFAWIRGKIAVLKEDKVRTLHRNTWLGLCGMILTGFLMFWPMREYLLTRPQFFAKMAFVLTLIVNGFVIGHLQKVALTKSFKELSLKEKLPLMISGIVSTLGWLGAMLGGYYLLPY
ncbi:MAG: hypothetical protein ACAH17_02995 [Candidatus Paceibacterota bacterium]